MNGYASSEYELDLQEIGLLLKLAGRDTVRSWLSVLQKELLRAASAQAGPRLDTQPPSLESPPDENGLEEPAENGVPFAAATAGQELHPQHTQGVPSSGTGPASTQQLPALQRGSLPGPLQPFQLPWRGTDSPGPTTVGLPADGVLAQPTVSSGLQSPSNGVLQPLQSSGLGAQDYTAYNGHTAFQELPPGPALHNGTSNGNHNHHHTSSHDSHNGAAAAAAQCWVPRGGPHELTTTRALVTTTGLIPHPQPLLHPPPGHLVFEELVNYSWEQEVSLLKIYVPLTGVRTEYLRATFEPTSFEVKVFAPSGKNYIFSVKQLYKSILCQACRVVASKTRKNILITLQKLRFTTPSEKRWEDIYLHRPLHLSPRWPARPLVF